MSTVVDDHETETKPSQATRAAGRLRATMAAARLSFTWLGTKKSLSSEQRNEAAGAFGAEGKFLSAGKKLFDTQHPAYKAVTAVRSRATSYWKGVSLPFPEPGIRLIRQDVIADFDSHMADFATELADAVAELDRHYEELRQAARVRLGSLFNATDYPPSLTGLFVMEHDYPSVEPPSYLQQLRPDLYAQECQRMQTRFTTAVEMAEQAFIDELSRLVSHLTERLAGDDDGRPKIFRDSAVSNLHEFFQRFQALNVRSNEELDDLVANCREIVCGVPPQTLRDDGGLRQRVATQLAGVQSTLDGLLVDRPRRRILRNAK